MLKRFKKFLEKNNFSDVELLRIRAAAEQFESTNKLAYGTIRSHITNLIDWSKYSDEQLIELALEADCFCFNLISSKLSLDNMSNEDKIQLGKKVGYGIDNHYVWSKIAESLELQGYSNLTLIKLGKLASNDRVWERVAQALSLDKLTNAQLMRLAFVAYYH